MDVLKTYGYYEAVVKGVKIMVFRSPDVDLIKTLATSSAAKTCPAPDGTVNLSCLPVLKLIRKIFSCFLATHTYPAFRNPEHEQSVEVWDASDDGSSGKRKADNQLGGKQKRVAREGTSGDHDEEMSEADDHTGRSHVPSGNTIRMALPPTRGDTPWGDEDAIPVTYGNFLQFVPDLANNDTKIVVSVIVKYFLSCLGSTAQEAFSTLESIKVAMGIIGNTNQGKELSHLAKCIDICLLAQARCFPIFSEGIYLGTVLSGFGHTIRIGDSDYTAQTHEIVKGLVNAAGPHKSTITAIARIAWNGSDVDGDGERLNISSMMELRHLVLDEWSLTESKRDEIVKLAKYLSFPSKSWPLSPNHLLDALRLLTGEARDLPNHLPIHPSKLLEQDRIACVWSAFGSMAPTCHFSGGPICRLSDATSSSGKIAWKQVPLADAIADMKRVLSSKEFSKASGNRRSGAFKDRIFDGVVAKDIWSALRLASGSNIAEKKNAKNTGVSGGADNLLAEYY